VSYDFNLMIVPEKSRIYKSRHHIKKTPRSKVMMLCFPFNNRSSLEIHSPSICWFNSFDSWRIPSTTFSNGWSIDKRRFYLHYNWFVKMDKEMIKFGFCLIISVRLCNNFVFNISKLNSSWIFILIKPNKSFNIRWSSCTHFSSNEKRISFTFFLRLSNNNKWMENKSNLFTCSCTYKEIMRKITRSHENNYGIPPDSCSCLTASKFSPCLNLFLQNLSKFVSRPFFSIRPPIKLVLNLYIHALLMGQDKWARNCVNSKRWVQPVFFSKTI